MSGGVLSGGVVSGGALSADAVSEQLRAHARAARDSPALLEGEVAVSWADLDRRCERVASELSLAGVRRGDVVAITVQPSGDTIAAILGALRAGAAVAPVSGRLTEAERAAVIDVLDPVLELGPAAAVRRGRRLAGPAVVVMTSGTTGRPKGVVLSPAAMMASADAWIAALPPATGWVLALGLGHVAGLGVVWRAIRARVPIRIVPAIESEAILAAVTAEPPMSHLSLVPAQLARLLDGSDDAAPPATLRAVPLGGGLIAPALVARALAAGWPVVPTYGLSEAGSGVTALSTNEAREDPGSAGRPLPGVSVSIDDPDTDRVGEILVASPAAFDGYLDEESRPRGAPIRTGDLGRLDDAGRLFVVDRRTDRIVRGGENIAPAEVEAVLERHPAIADAAVIGRPDATQGQVPVAVVAVRPGAAHPGSAALAAHARASLAGFKVPVSFIRVAALPRTSGGKLRRGEVRAMLDRPLVGSLVRPDGTRIGWRSTGTGPEPLILLHGTLSTARQLDRLAAELARPGRLTVHAVDRRASGASRVTDPAPLDVAVHVDDLLAVLVHLGIDAASLVGLSFGAVLALEAAARHPERVAGVVAWEPPYVPLADEPTRERLARVAAATRAAHQRAGAPAAAETFLRGVAGDAAWERLPDRARAFLAGEGDVALADAGLLGLDPDGLAGIAAPVILVTGSASEPFYAPIARALATRIPGARLAELDGLGHAAPITEPGRVAATFRACLEGVPGAPAVTLEHQP